MTGDNGKSPIFLTSKEVAHILRINIETLYQLIRRDRHRKAEGPPHIRIGSKQHSVLRFPAREFYKWAGIEKD